MATKCETQFYDALNNYNHRGEKPKWDDVTDLIGKWQKALDSVGIARWDQVNINDVRKVDTALTSNERRIRELRTGLDAILDKHISEQVKAEHRKFIANYRNESAVMGVLAEMTTIASQKTDTPSATDMVVALRDLLARPADNSKIGLSLEEQQHVQFAEYFNNLVVGKIYERIPEARITKLFNDKQFVDDLVAEMHRTQQQFNTKQYVSKNTDAQAVADILNDALAQMNLRLTQLGRKTPFSTRNLLPNFNWQRIRSWIKERGDTGENDFVTFFAQRLDNDMDEAVRQEVAQQVLDSLKTTQGYIDWDSVVENVQANAKNTPIKQRIQFKDGQSWNELNDAFGERDFMSTMITQFKYGSKQIAIAQMFGPDWQRNWNEIQNRVRQAQVGNERIFSTKEWRRTQNTFDRLTASPKVAEGLKWQSLTATGRSLEIASKLGSAVITALMDAPTAINVVTRLYGNSFMRNIDSVMSGFTQREARQYAERLNIGVDGMMGALQDRFMMYDDWQSMNVAQRKISNVSNFIMKVSGLETWTDMFRAGVTALFRKEIGTLLEQAKTWDQLDSRFKATLERFRISEAEWKTLSKNMLDEKGKFDVFAVSDRQLRDKLSGWFKDAVETAIISPSLRDVEHASWMVQAGTNTEATIKTMMQFKQFPLSFSRKILGRAWKDTSQTKWQKLNTFTQLAAMGTLMGAVVVQTQQVVSGKQPYKLDSLELWTRSFVLASPLGLMTDVFMESGGENLVRLALGLNAKQIDITKLIFGPLFSDLAKGTQLVGETVGVGANALLTEFGIVEPSYDANIQLDKRMSKLTQWALRQVPGQNLWQTKAMYNMLFADALQEMMDPQSYRRAQRYIQKDSELRIDNEAFNPYGKFLEESKKSLIQ